MPCLGLGLSIAARRPLLAGDGLGTELISNGGFDSDTVWTKGAGWVIQLWQAYRVPDGNSSGLSQAVAFEAGKTYSVTYTVAAYSAGAVLVQFTGGTTRSGTARSANGTYTETLVANSGNNSFRLFANGIFQAQIDNVSVREVL